MSPSRRAARSLVPALFSALLLLGLFASAAGAEGCATLYRGSKALGPVAILEGAGGPFVSLTDVGALLGFTSAPLGEELHLSQGNVKIRLVRDAVAAWYNLYLVPMYGAPFERDGRWWLDIPSVQALFQNFTGRGDRDRLRFDLGGGQTPAPAVAAPTPAPTPAPMPMPTPAPTPASKEGPRLETLLPGSGRQPASQEPHGTALRLRWSTTRERVRAVIDCVDGATPEIRLAAGTVEVVFAEAQDPFDGLASPYANVTTSLRRDPKGAVFTFSSQSRRVEKLVLDNPRRIVFDFFFGSPSEIRPAAAPQAPALPQPGLPKPKKGPAPKGRLLVVLDPGHGGKDPGAVANGVKEKAINLAVGLEMEKILKAQGVDVIMTRRTDVYLKLQERTDIANRADADMFVSIHANALPPGKNSSGFEIYIMALPTDKDALELAKIENREYVEGKTAGQAVDRKTEMLLKILGDMQQNNKINESTAAAEALFRAGKSHGLPMKRVAQAPFFVLRGAGMPAVLLETGFLTNAREAKLLAHSGYQRRIAEAMSAGVLDYLR
ncbi:MAG: N-acetylmuramoyl-L-alanine amidase [Fretibacterium sp.]|nr:N-acetylmuramoyl-L-alanine amidase [Fretibacterium sp.]